MKEMMKSYLDERRIDGPNRKNIDLLFQIWQDRIARIYINMQNIRGPFYRYDDYEIPEEIPFEDIPDYLINELTEDDISIIEDILELYSDPKDFINQMSGNCVARSYDTCMQMVDDMFFR